MNCEFRIMKDNDNENKPYSIQEVYLDDEGEVCVAHSIDFIVEGKSVSEMKDILSEMRTAFDKPILPTFRDKEYAQDL